MTIQLFNKSNLDVIEWEKYQDGQYAKNFLEPFIQNGVNQYIENVDTDLMIIAIDDILLPITKNNKEFDNSYVVSPYTHYISYAYEELHALNKPWLNYLLSPLLSLLSYLFKCANINKVIIVNNWMVSTNLYFNLTTEQIHRLTSFLKHKFPEHSIIFRSIHTYDAYNLFSNFKENQYKMIPSRQVYFYDSMRYPLTRREKKSVNRDAKLLKDNNYIFYRNKDLHHHDIETIRKLYEDLYLHKYSILNPIFTNDFIQLAIEKEILQIIAISENGNLIGVLGYFQRNGFMTAPLFGYDTSLPINKGLYRVLSNLIMNESSEKQLIAHQSSGAADFKRARGGKPNIEYNAIYDSHLPFNRRIIWSVLEFLLNQIGVPILKKYKL